jgi:hypothetical protein
MGDAIAREAKRKRPNPNRDRTEVCDLMPVRFQGMTLVSDGDKKDLWRFIPQRSDAPSAHRRPGYSLSGCTPAEPDSASPGAGSIAKLLQPVQGQRFNLVSKRWYLRHGSPGMGASLHVGKDTPSEIQQNLGVPVENILTSDFL